MTAQGMRRGPVSMPIYSTLPQASKAYRLLNAALKQLGGFKTADLPGLLKGKIQLAP